MRRLPSFALRWFVSCAFLGTGSCCAAASHVLMVSLASHNPRILVVCHEWVRSYAMAA